MLQYVFYGEVGDYQVEKYHFKIGGKNKSHKQFKNSKNAFIAADDIVIGYKDVIPLYLFGLLY